MTTQESEKGHTAGPWWPELAADRKTGEEEWRIAYNAENNWLATVWICDDSEAEVAEAAAAARLIALSTVIPDLYSSELNARISWFWDGGYDLALGDHLNGYVDDTNVDTWVEALEWLQAAAIRHFPNSDFAKARTKGGA